MCNCYCQGGKLLKLKPADWDYFPGVVLWWQEFAFNNNGPQSIFPTKRPLHQPQDKLTQDEIARSHPACTSGWRLPSLNCSQVGGKRLRLNRLGHYCNFIFRSFLVYGQWTFFSLWRPHPVFFFGFWTLTQVDFFRLTRLNFEANSAIFLSNSKFRRFWATISSYFFTKVVKRCYLTVFIQ